jgi:hypothetical protein
VAGGRGNIGIRAVMSTMTSVRFNTVEKTKTIPLTPLLGGLALVGGIVLLVAGPRT